MDPYRAVFIAIAADCPVDAAEVPPARAGGPTVAGLHHALAAGAPYAWTHDEVIFRTHLLRSGLDPAAHPVDGQEWRRFFAKGQPCLRASPLAKRYGWGFHVDEGGRVAAIPAGSPAYAAHAADPELRQLKAMRSARARPAGG